MMTHYSTPTAGAEMSNDRALGPGPKRLPAWVRVVETTEDLASLRSGWQKLADESLDANVFFEPWNLIPAVEAFGVGKRLAFLFVFHQDLDHGQTPIGFVPIERISSFRGWPASILAVWHHDYCRLSTPLLHKSYAREAWRALIDWAKCDRPGASLIEFPYLLAEGSSYQALVDVMFEAHMMDYSVEHYTRAVLCPNPAGAVAYITNALSAGKRKELRRQRNRIQEVDGFNIRKLYPTDAVDPWIETFLALEAAGWKGNAKSAIACNVEDANYFRSICRAAHLTNRLHMMGFFVNDVPIALKCNFLTSDGGFAFKITYAENFSKFSPGALLELELIEDAHREGKVRWIDSCAIPFHPMIDILWTERRSIKHLLLSTGKTGNVLIALFQTIRAFRRHALRA